MRAAIYTLRVVNLNLFRKYFKKTSVLSFVSGFALVISLYQTSLMLNNYSEKSKSLFVAKNSELSTLINNSKNALFVSENPSQEFLTLAMYGKFRMITDGWEPELIPQIDGNVFRVYNLVWKSNKVDFEYIGNLNTPDRISGNLNLEKIKELMK